jgi:2-oxoglutarate ferredoxin oxidoreductase subunit beta
MIVFTYQGDGDLASIGMSEIIHAANRGEKFTTIFVNNAIYGMTGGQMAPTTLAGQIATTCPLGRDTSKTGMPIRMCELLSGLVTPSYLERVSVHNPQQIIRAKKAIRRAFQYQIENKCFSLIEVLSTCPTNWGKTPGEATDWVEGNLKSYFPLGIYKSPEGAK